MSLSKVGTWSLGSLTPRGSGEVGSQGIWGKPWIVKYPCDLYRHVQDLLILNSCIKGVRQFGCNGCYFTPEIRRVAADISVPSVRLGAQELIWLVYCD